MPPPPVDKCEGAGLPSDRPEMEEDLSISRVPLSASRADLEDEKFRDAGSAAFALDPVCRPAVAAVRVRALILLDVPFAFAT
jgi:hypothetical protein